MAIADLNDDNKPDLVVGNRNASTISILWGNGDGTFTVPDTSWRGQEPIFGGGGRLNGDGSPDVVTTSMLKTR